MTTLRIFAGLVLVLTFFACQEQNTAPAAAPATETMEAAGPNIVFVRFDSLQAGYTELASELDRLQTNYAAAEKNHQNRVSAFSREVQKLQNEAQQGLLTPNKMQSEQERLARKEQQIQQQLQVALGSIQADQQKLQDQFGTRVKEILEEMMDENGYDYILNEGGGGGVLLGNDKFDVTALVLEKLNASGSVLEAEAEDATEE